MLCSGHPTDVNEAKVEFIRKFSCDNISKFKEYVGYKIVRDNGTTKIRQPVLL